MQLEPDDARRRFATGRVARLATVSATGAAALVPVCFAVDGEVVYTPVDHKPKTTRNLARLRNAEATGQAVLLVDHYDDVDWTALWWVQAKGDARVLRSGEERDHGALLLRRRYRQYHRRALAVLLVVDVHEWRGWTAS